MNKTLKQLLERFPKLNLLVGNYDWKTLITDNKDDNSTPIYFFIDTESNIDLHRGLKGGFLPERVIGYINVEHLEHIELRCYEISIKEFEEIKEFLLEDWEEKFKASNKSEFFIDEKEARQAYWTTVDGETSQSEEEFLQDCFVVEYGE